MQNNLGRSCQHKVFGYFNAKSSETLNKDFHFYKFSHCFSPVGSDLATVKVFIN